MLSLLTKNCLLYVWTDDAVVDVTSSLTSDPRTPVIFCVNSSQTDDELFDGESTSIVMDDGTIQYIMLPLKLNK